MENDNIESADLGISPDELDDVEAHGLREIAAGVGAAAIIGGGVAAVVAQTGSSASFASPDSSITLTPDVTQLAAHETDSLAGTTQAAVDRLAAETDAATTTAKAATEATDRAVTGASATVGNVAAAAGLTTISAHAGGTSVEVGTDALKVVDTTKATAVNTADKTVAKTVATEKQAVSKVSQTAVHLVSSTRSVAGWALGLKVMSTEVQVQGVHLNPIGQISVTDATGAVVGSATLSNGGATIHITAAHTGATFTIHYPGDAGHGASSLTWSVPSV